MRRLLTQVGGQAAGRATDPFPDLEGEDYLLAIWPWFLAHAQNFPPWALEYVFRIGGGFWRDVSRWSERAPAKPRRLQTAKDIVDVLEEQVEALRSETGSSALERARAIGYLAGLARKAIETGALAARLEMLEAVLESRTKEPRSKTQ